MGKTPVKLKIAQFTFGLQLAGQERVVVDLAKAFHKADHHSEVCTTQFGGELVQELKVSNIPFNCLNLAKSYHPKALMPVIRYLRDNKVDVVITHGKSGCMIPRIAAILSRVPVFIHVEHSVSDEKRFYHIIFNKLIYHFTNKIVCVSENAKQSLVKIERIDPDKVLVIHNGIDTSRFLTSQDMSEKHNKVIKKVGIVARFDEVKGHAYLVMAAVKIVQTYKDVEFIFVGDGPLKKMIEHMTKEYKIESYCHFLGVRDDVRELLQTFDVFVLSSLWEGLPISLLEAQHLGIASVATDVGGIPEVINHGYNGLLVPPKDSDALASAILTILGNEKLKSEIGMNAKKESLRKFSAEKMTNEYLNLIYGLLYKKAIG